MTGHSEPRPKVLVITDDPDLERILHELLATVAPSVVAESATPADAPLTEASYAIVDHTVRALPGIIVVQELRARGFRGGIVLLDSAPTPDLEHRLLSVAPARPVARERLTADLARALAALIDRGPPGGELAAVERDLRRTQQLIAIGETTSRIQHTLSNPLTALLAEAQLLEMEPLGEENIAAVRRIIEQARRVVAMVRGLQEPQGKEGTA